MTKWAAPFADVPVLEGSCFDIALPYTDPPVSGNDMARGGAGRYYGHNSAKRGVAEAVCTLVRVRQIPRLHRVAVTLTWYRLGRPRCDPDGLYPMLKACIDALTPPEDAIAKGSITKAGTARKHAKRAKIGAGVIRDDSAEVIESTTCRIVLDAATPMLVLTLEVLSPLQPRAHAPVVPVTGQALAERRAIRRQRN